MNRFKAMFILFILWILIFFIVLQLANYFKNLLLIVRYMMSYNLNGYILIIIAFSFILTYIYVFLFPSKINIDLYKHLKKKNISIIKYRMQKNEPIYPIDVIYGDILINKNKYFVISVSLTYICFFIFVKYLFIIYIFSYFLLLFIYFFIYINKILYYIIANIEKTITINLNKFDTWDIKFISILWFIINENVKIKAFLIIYILLSKKTKQIEILEIFKRIFLTKLLAFPLWFIGNFYFLNNLIYNSLINVNWSTKNKKNYIAIFIYEFLKILPIKINEKYSDVLKYMNNRSIIIKNNVTTNSYIDQITQKFLIKQLKNIEEYQEYVSKILNIPHRVVPYGDNINHEDKFIVAQSYTSKHLIRLNNYGNLNNMQKNNENNIKNILFQTKLQSVKQCSFITALPSKIIQPTILKNFFKQNQIYNIFQYKTFKICERAMLIKNALEFEKNLNKTILLQDLKSSVFTSYKELKNNNLIASKSIDFVENVAKENMDELIAFVTKEMSGINHITHNPTEVAHLVLENLENATFNRDKRIGLMVDGLLNHESNQNERKILYDILTSTKYDL